MIKLTEILQEVLNQQQIVDVAKEFMNSESYNSNHDCKRSTFEFIKWVKKNKEFEPIALLLAPPKDIKTFPGKSGDGDSHIFSIIDGYGVDFTADQFPGVSEPLKITPESQIPSEYKKIGGYYTLYPDWFENGKTLIKTKFNNLPQWFRDGFEKEGFKPDLNESIDKIAGVWDTDEKFKDGSDFKIKFKVSNIIDLAKNTPVKEIDPKSIKYNFSGRQDSDPSKTKERVMKADLSYPIIVVKNKAGKIFAMLDGTHRLEKALNLGLDKIKTKILNKEDLIQFKTDKLNEAKQSNFNIKDIAQEFMSSKSYNKSDDCKISTYKFVNWLKTNKNINPDVLLLAPPKDIKKYPGKSKEGDSHIFTIINGNGIDFTANQFPGVSEPLKITPEAQIPSEYKRIGGYYTSTPDYFKNKTFIKDKFNNLPQWFHDGLKSSLNEAKQSNPPITRIYFDLDGVLAGFDEQFTKYNDEGLEFKEYIGKYGSSKAWDIINKGKVKFWSEMPWNPGGQQLYNKVMELAKAKNFEVWILSSPGLDPNGDAKKGKNIWVDKHLNIPLNHRVYKQAKEKHTEAKPGYMLIDDMGSNVSQFIEAGGTGIKNNPKDSTESIKKLYKFKYEQRNPTKKRIY